LARVLKLELRRPKRRASPLGGRDLGNFVDEERSTKIAVASKKAASVFAEG
jgi:hypothetical protein